ncbi:MAG TPA: hypothetical protein VLA45_15190 [Paracoccaceae bacterium]|nr:hypothetical protein [Paracoccaceae bacterium]
MSIAAATTLAACSTPAWVSPVEVTRFVGSAPAQLGTGTISIAAGSMIGEPSVEYGLYRDALAAELTALGYRVVDGPASQVATLAIDERVSEGGARRNPVSVGGGAGIGSYGSSVGLGLGIDLSPPPADQVERQVSVTIRPSTGGQNLWEGRARYAATVNHELAAPAAAATRSMDALFAGFPGNSGETVEVE